MIRPSEVSDPSPSFEEEHSTGDEKDGPSLHDVKRALRENFAATGVIDDVTARLRRQFVCELRRKGLGVVGAREAVTAKSLTGISLRERVFHSLVVDHLASNGLLQSLAVFLAESGLGSSSSSGSSSDRAALGTRTGPASATAAALCREDVLQALPIPADSALFRRVISRAGEGESKNGGMAPAAPGGTPPPVMLSTASTATDDGYGASQGGYGGVHGFSHHHHHHQQQQQQQQQERRRVCGLLEALVGEVAAKSRAIAVDSNTQTDEPGRSHKENLVSRLEAVRETWLRRSADERRAPAQDVTERMLAFQRECELRAAAQTKAEREIFRERDLAALRLQMTSTHRRETEAVRKELQSQYDARVERLRETERERERRDKDRLRDVEVSQFEARQNLLREMDLLRSREQEIRRSAELDARAVRAEELRLRDQATALEARAEEVRRRGQEGERGREDALQAARHEARQSLEVKEEGVAREREFLKQEMAAVRAERKACQEQLFQHTETSRALQEARSDVLAQEARAMAVEAEAERLREQAAVYKEAYEMRREVAQEGDRAFVRIGRQELEARVGSLETSMEEERARQAKALKKAVAERDALKAEVKCLRERERRWEAEATELSRALSSAELERDRAEHRAEEEECERFALDGQVEELRAALRRSRDAIEAIRLCDVEADASASLNAAAATAAAAAAAANLAVASVGDDLPANGYGAVRADADHLVHASSSNFGAGGAASPPGRQYRLGLHGGEGGKWGGSPCDRRLAGVGEWPPTVDGREPIPVLFRGGRGGGDSPGRPPGRATVFGCHSREQLDGGEWITQELYSGEEERAYRPVRRRSGSGGRRHRRRRRSGGTSRRGQQVIAEPEWWSDGYVGGNRRDDSTDGGGGGGRRSRSRRRLRLRDTGHGGGGGESGGVGGDGRRSRDSSRRFDRRGGSRAWDGNEEHGSVSDQAEEVRGSDWGSRRPSSNGGKQRRFSAAAATANEIVARERLEAAELLLVEERERMARDLEAERARFRERDVLREEERRREREAERARREEVEVESMRRRLEEEEDKAAAAAAARRRKSRTGQERRRPVREEDEQEAMQAGVRERRRKSRPGDVSGEKEEQEEDVVTACHTKSLAGSVKEGAEEERMGKQMGRVGMFVSGQERASPEAISQVLGTAQSASTRSTPGASSPEPLPQPAAKSPYAIGLPSAAAAATSGILRGDDGNKERKQEQQQQQQKQQQPSAVNGDTGQINASDDGSSVPDGSALSASSLPEPAQNSPTLFGTSIQDPTGQLQTNPTQVGKPLAASTDHPGSDRNAENAGSPTHDGPEAADTMTETRVRNGQPDTVDDSPVAREGVDADETAKTQVDREVEEYREKIRQRRQKQQQQQQKDQMPPVRGKNMAGVAASGGVTMESAAEDHGGEGVQHAGRRWQESASSDGGGGDGSVSELSEPTTGTRGNLEVGGGQSSGDREDAEQRYANAAAGDVGPRSGAGGFMNEDDAGSRQQDVRMARSAVVESSSRGDSGYGSGAGSARFSGIGGNSEGSDNDWF